MIGTILVILLIMILVGAFHPGITSSVGYWPSGGLGLIFLLLLILFLAGRL